MSLLLCALVSAVFATHRAQGTPPNEYACEADRIYEGCPSTGNHTGWSLSAGDWNGNGQLDVLAGGVGKWEGGLGNDNATYAAIYLDPAPSAVPGEVCTSVPDLIVLSDENGGVGDPQGRTGDRFALSVAFVGDIDGDTRDDFVVGAPRGPFISGGGPLIQGGWRERGRVYVFLSSDWDPGRTTTCGIPAHPSDASLVIEMPPTVTLGGTTMVTDGFRFGYAVSEAGHFLPPSTGETDRPDFAVGVPGGNEFQSPTWEGAVVVIAGEDVERHVQNPGYAQVVSLLDLAVFPKLQGRRGGAERDRYGHSVAFAGDAQGLLPSAILVGAPQYQVVKMPGSFGADTHAHTGQGYVQYWPSGGTLVKLCGEADGDEFGWDVAGADRFGSSFDLNGDFIDEVLVGAPRWDAPGAGTEDDRGRAYVFDLLQGKCTPVTVATHTGEVAGDEFGAFVGVMGHIDPSGDAVIDYAVGAIRFGIQDDEIDHDPGTGPCQDNSTYCTGGDENLGGGASGKLYLYSGTAVTSDDPFQTYQGEDGKDSLGLAAVRIGDVASPPGTPTGLEDVLVAGPRYGITGFELGRIYLFVH